MKRISQLLSLLFSPLLVPTYGMMLASFLSVLAILPHRVLWTTVAITFVITCVLPLTVILALYKSGMVKDPGLNERGERFIPYGVAMLCYLGCAFFSVSCSRPCMAVAVLCGRRGCHSGQYAGQSQVEDIGPCGRCERTCRHAVQARGYPSGHL